MSDLSQRMEFAVETARAAGEITLRYFRTGAAVDRKADSTPVTEADRGAERFIRERLHAAYPRDGVLGEEFGEEAGTSGRRWIIDPIDGTKSFIRGVPLFGVLIGLEGPECCEVGVVHFPALGETVWAARGEGAWWDGSRVRVSAVKDLSDACLVYTSQRNFERAGAGVAAAWRRLSEATWIQRGWGDCYGHMLVATGRAEAMFDPLLNPWDCAPFPPILEEAGGTFTDLGGKRTIRGGSGISTNGLLFDPVYGLVRGPGPGAGSTEGHPS